jgi:hypothetical protein
LQQRLTPTKVRRTFIAVCLILIAIYLLPNLDFSDLSLFGIKPEKGGHNARHLVVWTLWLLWLYHAVLFTYYTQRDWKDWRSSLHRSSDAFPELRMYFRIPPSKSAPRTRIVDVEPGWKWEKAKDANKVGWNCIYTTKLQGPATANYFMVPSDKARSVRSRIVWGLGLIDIGIPLALSIVALYLAQPFTHVASCFTSSDCPLLFGLWF